MADLSGRERLLRVFHQREVDRIPVAPFIHINYVKEFFGTQDVDWVAKTPDVYAHFGFDLCSEITPHEKIHVLADAEHKYGGL